MVERLHACRTWRGSASHACAVELVNCALRSAARRERRPEARADVVFGPQKRSWRVVPTVFGLRAASREGPAPTRWEQLRLSPERECPPAGVTDLFWGAGLEATRPALPGEPFARRCDLETCSSRSLTATDSSAVGQWTVQAGQRVASAGKPPSGGRFKQKCASSCWCCSSSWFREVNSPGLVRWRGEKPHGRASWSRSASVSREANGPRSQVDP
jgi:hypothetical protein